MRVVSVVFFFSHLVFIQPRICTVIESNTRTKMKEERKGEGRGKKKCCYLCYIQSSTEFLHNLWCNPNSCRLATITSLLQNKVSILPLSAFQGLFSRRLACHGFIVLSFLSAFSAPQRVKRPFRSSLDATQCLTRKLPA